MVLCLFIFFYYHDFMLIIYLCNRNVHSGSYNLVLLTMGSIEIFKKFTYLFILILFIGCSSPLKELSTQLDEIEQLIPQDATLAQAKLDSLYETNTQLFTTPSFHARHILLDTYCKYRNNQEGRSDSLISIAEDYILQHGTIRQKMLCHLLHGVILNNSYNNSQAMLHFQYAASEGNGSDEHFLLGQIYSHMCDFCHTVEDYDCQKYAKAALYHYQQYGEPLYIEDAHYFVAMSYMDRKSYDSCYHYVKHNLQRATQNSDTFLLYKNTRLLAKCELHLGLYDSAIIHTNIIKSQYKEPFNYEDFGTLAQASAKIGHNSEAYQYLDSAQIMFSGFEYQRLYNYKSQAQAYHDIGDDVNAFKSYNLYQALRDTIADSWTAKKVATAQRDFVLLQLEKEKTEQTVKYYKMISLITLLFIIVIRLCYHIRRSKITRKRLEEINHLQIVKQELLTKELATRQENERLLQEQVRQIELNKQHAIFCIKQTEPIQHFNQALKGKYRIQESDWQKLDTVFQELLPNFREVLQETSKLNEIEWRICQLQKLDYTPREIGELVNRASNSISSASARLFSKTHLAAGGAREWLEYIHSI